jgi:hypothetical protein
LVSNDPVIRARPTSRSGYTAFLDESQALYRLADPILTSTLRFFVAGSIPASGPGVAPAGLNKRLAADFV